MKMLYKAPIPGNSLAVQWLGLGVLTAKNRIQSLVREERSLKSFDVPKKKKKKKGAHPK